MSEIVLGPPGTGKTTTLLGVVDEELSTGVDPAKIGFVTFTRQAAHEAITRACTKFKYIPSQLPYFRTLHSLCFWAGGLSPSDVLERSKLEDFGDWVGYKITGRWSLTEGSTFGYEVGDRILFMENLARIRCIPLRQQYDEDCDGLPWHDVDKLSRALAEYKRSHHLVDYTDMLSNLLQSPWDPRLEVLLVDEAQDLSQLQWRVVEKLSRGTRRVVIAGDDDQAIYKWAGADVPHFIGMPGQVRVLDQSWRVPKAVQEVSSDVISMVHHRRPKTWHPRSAAGVVARVNGINNIDFAGDDVLVLARNTFLLKEMVVPLLRSSGVLYTMHGFSSVRQSVLEAVVNWEKLRKGESITVEEALGVYDFMSSGKGVLRGYKKLPGMVPTDMVGINNLKEKGGLVVDGIWHDAMDRIPLDERTYMLSALRSGEKLRAKPRVRLSTIHGSKGGQARHVVLLTDMAHRTFYEMQREVEDEARVWYVAVTRTQEQLSIVAPRTRKYFVL